MTNQLMTIMKRINILVVEDSETSGMLIQSMFEENPNYKVNIATTGSEALQQIKDNKPDIILLDIMLPDIDGFTILRRLKHQKVTARIPVIIVSAKDKHEDVVLGKKLGAIDYVIKPIGTNKLYERVNLTVNELIKSN